MVTTVVHLSRVSKGVYELPEFVVFYADEPMESLDTLIDVNEERVKLRYKGKQYMINVYMECFGTMRAPHMLMSDLERISS